MRYKESNMKKTKALLITALAAAMLMGGCGDKKDTTTATTEAATEATTAAAVTTEAGKDDTTAEKKDTTEDKEELTTASATETTVETTEATTEDDSEAAPDAAEAKELMAALNRIDYLGACAVQNDYSVVYEDEKGYRYHPVTDPDFKTVADLENYINRYLTKSFINERYSAITGTDVPEYIDVDGVLYVIEAGKGAGFDFLEADPDIEKTSENGYTIMANYDNFGVLDTLAIMIEKEDGRWKINGISYGM